MKPCYFLTYCVHYHANGNAASSRNIYFFAWLQSARKFENSANILSHELWIAWHHLMTGTTIQQSQSCIGEARTIGEASLSRHNGGPNEDPPWSPSNITALPSSHFMSGRYCLGVGWYRIPIMSLDMKANTSSRYAVFGCLGVRHITFIVYTTMTLYLDSWM